MKLLDWSLLLAISSPYLVRTFPCHLVQSPPFESPKDKLQSHRNVLTSTDFPTLYLYQVVRLSVKQKRPRTEGFYVEGFHFSLEVEGDGGCV
jgi:hypothetical protein